MTIEQEQEEEQPEPSEEESEEIEEEEPIVRFNLSRDWVTGESNLIKRMDSLEEGYVDLSRRARAQMSNLELIIEGIEELQRTKPTYQILVRKEEEAFSGKSGQKVR